MQQQHTLILGGQKSGKSRYAEWMAGDWLAAAPTHRAILIATAYAHDSEMAERIARHRSDRAARVPQLQTQEETLAVAECIAQRSRPDTLLVVDCLNLWLTNMLMPMRAEDALPPEHIHAQTAALQHALAQAPGPVVLVSNEIGLGLIPMQPAVRHFVDELGLLNQALAQSCAQVLLMVAGLPLQIKSAAAV
ncbi:MAG: bifunctional adenosylcobinamide kinase/adenosylcobinamide-phosphate guanylyltransferase [Brachymonas sp.]|jgi:adenosylcobinamide kinase/adenosylcobinamide-phosphate guanylyltransferase